MVQKVGPSVLGDDGFDLFPKRIMSWGFVPSLCAIIEISVMKRERERQYNQLSIAITSYKVNATYVDSGRTSTLRTSH